MKITRSSLAHHLRVAAEQYKRDVTELDGMFNLSPNVRRRLALQFMTQRDECHRIATALDDCTSIMIDMGE